MMSIIIAKFSSAAIVTSRFLHTYYILAII